MEINDNVKQYNIKLVKFTSGEEIIGDVTEVKAMDGYKIEKPIRIVIMPPAAGSEKPVVGFSAFIPYVEEDVFTIARKDILLVATPNAVIVDQWKSIFGKKSSLWLPPAGAIQSMIDANKDKKAN